MPKVTSTDPLTLACLHWAAEAERQGRQLPAWVHEMRAWLQQQPRRRGQRVTAWASAGRPSEN